jgi:DNA-binding NarL/FixJ family response regulator
MSEPIKVVIVDDNDDIRAILRYNLQFDPRFKIVGEAYDGRSAMRVIESERPDVVILDLMMPHMDGFHAIPQIKFSSPDTKIAVYTAAEVEEVGLMYRGANSVQQKGEMVNPYMVAETLAALCAE